MDWSYGKAMLEQEDIKSLDEWSDDKEMAYSIMDQRFDYLWNGLEFTDRLYSDGMTDETVEKRIAAKEAKLKFENFGQVFWWILGHSNGDEDYIEWIKRRI